jgi:hypothetical protein
LLLLTFLIMAGNKLDVATAAVRGRYGKTRKADEGKLRRARMNRSSRRFQWLVAVIFSAITSLSLFAAAGKQTFTGEVGDAMCGRKHMAGETAAECTRACVGHGSKFALVVGDKIYTLETDNKAALATLDQQAGKMATVTGTLDGDTIVLSSVTAK